MLGLVLLGPDGPAGPRTVLLTGDCALPPTFAEIRSRLPQLMLADQHRLARRIDRAVALRDVQRREQALAQIGADVEAAAARIQARRAAVPVIGYPAELPVSQRKDEIAQAIRDHQVVIVAGETGSGKTTQIPKICLELGRGVTGQIGHTQPRRLAARTVAERIAEELGTELGDTIGYQVRFTDQSGDGTLVKLMTDGILLTELTRDRRLLRYDTLIIDEAHERSLNIDFILGYLHRLLPSRPDLKVVITSATIDPERFSQHFSGPGKAAPIVEVSGRTYPVQVRYRPLAEPAAESGSGRPASRGTRSRASSTPSTSCGPAARATSWSSSAANGRSATPRTRWPAARTPISRWSRCTLGCHQPSSTECSPRTGGAGSCWPPTSRRLR